MSPPRRPYDRRQQSEPIIRFNNNNNNNGGGGVYPSPGYQRSRDTVNTGESSEPWTNNTDPSSENSSIDQIRAAPKYDQIIDSYSGGSFQQRPIREEKRMDSRPGPSRPPAAYQQHPRQQQQQQQYDNNPPPPPPHKQSENRPPKQGNRLMKIGSGGQGGPPPVPSKDASKTKERPALQSSPSQKRQSWLKRKLSKKVQSTSWFNDD